MTVTNDTRRRIMLIAWDFFREDPHEGFGRALKRAWAYVRRVSRKPDRIMRQIEEERATLPPTDDFRERERQREFEERATRGKVRNEHKSQRRSLMLMVLLALASACLVAWGIKLMGH